jgi:hypothetical protein
MVDGGTIVVNALNHKAVPPLEHKVQARSKLWVKCPKAAFLLLKLAISDKMSIPTTSKRTRIALES